MAQSYHIIYTRGANSTLYNKLNLNINHEKGALKDITLQ